MYVTDRYGWPVEQIKGRWLLNLLRLLIHARRIHRGRWHERYVVTCDPSVGQKEASREA